ncbi:hypothetical protein ABH086_16625, partial [Bacteroides stercoris]
KGHYTYPMVAQFSTGILAHFSISIYTLRLTPDAAKFLPEWIESNLMEEMDAESFYGMKYAQERDEEREAKGLD